MEAVEQVRYVGAQRTPEDPLDKKSQEKDGQAQLTLRLKWKDRA